MASKGKVRGELWLRLYPALPQPYNIKYERDKKKKQNNKQTKKDLAAASLYLLLQYALFLLLFASLPNCYTVVKGQEVFLFFFPFVFSLRFCLTVSSNISFGFQIGCLLVLFLV